MHTAARSLVRVQSSIQPLAHFSSRVGTTAITSVPFCRSHSLRSAANYANKTSIRSQVKPMSNLQPYLRVGIRNMGGESPIDVEVFGKAAVGTGNPSKVRGDCPFSQRIYLDLEEKSIPYKATYIQEGNDKPDWFIEHNAEGLMPVLRDGEKWIQDSDKIAQYLEEKYPDPSLKTPAEYKNVGAEIFPEFMNYLKSKNPEDPSKQKLLSEIEALEKHLKAHGPYIGGEKATDSDFALIPKLRHMRVALKYYYEFDFPSQFPTVAKYIELLESRPSFKRTDVPDDMIVEGWGKKFELSGKIVQPQTA